MQSLHRRNEKGIGDADDRFDAAGEAVFKQGRAEGGDHPLTQLWRNAHGGDEKARELVDTLSLRQAGRSQMQEMVAE